MIGKRAKNDGARAQAAEKAPVPNEVRFRNWVLTLALILGPPALLYLHYRLMFPGLTNADAMDFAQIGRNLHEGRGFERGVRPIGD